jgi:alpha-D-ribose 1-methylphosphonate 5-triphosphate diphosphatase
VALASANPAKALGLNDRGRIAKGLRADLVIAERGRMPRLRATIRGGRLVWSDGTLSEAVRSITARNRPKEGRHRLASSRARPGSLQLQAE